MRERLGLLALIFVAACAPGPGDVGEDAKPRTERALSTAEECVAGCAADVEAPPGVEVDFAALLATYAGDEERRGPALENLLFHGEATRAWLERSTPEALPAGHRRFLERELARRHVLLELRVVDGAGRTRLALEPSPMELGHKAHLHATNAASHPFPEISGTVRRVGVERFWARL